MLIGYVRVSKADGSQTLSPQRDALLSAGVDASRMSIGVQKGPPIGVQKGPPSSSSVTGMTGALFVLVAA